MKAGIRGVALASLILMGVGMIPLYAAGLVPHIPFRNFVRTVEEAQQPTVLSAK